jgi:pimeloyl-ACP methyl ester carboxylesterase
MMRTVDVDGRKLSAWVSGEFLDPSRKTLVFIHGSAGDHTNWICQYSALKDRFQIAVLELPGHGRSEGPGEQSVDAYVEWVRKTVAALGIARPVLIGHSLGAATSLTFAVRHGSLLAGIVPVGGGARMPVNPAILEGLKTNPAPIYEMVVKFSFARANRERFDKVMVESLSRVDAMIFHGDLTACDRLDLTETAGSIAVPTLVVCGEDDKMTPPALSEFLRDAIPGAKMAPIPGAGHFVMMENPEAFNQAVSDFVESL